MAEGAGTVGAGGDAVNRKLWGGGDRIAVSALREIVVRYPGDFYELAMLMVRLNAARDALPVPAGGSRSITHSTVHGIAGQFANLARMPVADVERVVEGFGVHPAAVVVPDDEPDGPTPGQTAAARR